MEKKRCFLAVKVPEVEQYRQRLQSISHDIDVKVSVTKPENYHFTLHFFGDVTPDQISKIQNACHQVSFDPFLLKLADPGIIPSNKKRKTRVLHINPTVGSYELTALVKTIRSHLSVEGFDTPSRQYLPHLTVARVRSGKEKAKLHDIWMDQNFEEVAVEVDKFSLIESELTPQGSIYHPLDSFTLN